MNELLPTSASRLFTLGETGSRVLRVTQGEVHLFARRGAAHDDAPRRHLVSIPEGGWIFDAGLDRLKGVLELPGDGDPGTRVAPVAWDSLPPEEVAIRLEEWIAAMLQAVLGLSDGEREVSHAAMPGELPPLPAGEVLGLRHGVAWWQPPAGAAAWLGRRPEGDLPLIPRLGVELRDAVPASRLLTTTEWVALPGWHERLEEIQRELAAALDEALARLEEKELERTRHRLALGEANDAAGWTEIADVLLPPSASAGGWGPDAENRAEENAFRRVARQMGVTPAAHAVATDAEAPLDKVAALARAASLRWRHVLLAGSWYARESGPMIGVVAATQETVALLPAGPRRYHLVHADGSVERMTEALSETLEPRALTFYRTLPSRKLKLRDIFRFSIRGSLGDFLVMAGMLLIAGLLGLATPALSARIYDVIIPQSERGLMVQITLILIAAALAKAGFELVRTIALMRVENRAESHLQAAVWDRLLNLPSHFFRRYTAGDLASRVQGVTEAHQILSSTGVSVLFTLPTGLFNLIVMFRVSPSLALWGLGIAVAGMVLSISFNVAEIFVLRRQYEIRGKLAGLVVQLINGVGKFRMANAEPFAFATWARDYAAQEKLSVRAGLWTVASQTFFSGFSLLVTALLFGLVGWQFQQGGADGHRLTTGSFLAFNAAFGVLIGSLVTVAEHSLGLLQLFPLLERTRPIFDAEPEVSETRAHPGELTGEIELSNVTFGYREDAPPVLDGLSLKIKPGEMVALVGPSGCGKSTLLRLLLGFEAPSSGSIFYDGKDLQTLNLQAVRRQIGVVLQNTQLFSGDIFRNIVGESNLTMKDAWEAAELAGLAADLRAMPMQMYTMVSEGGSGFSGGQKQRLAIARAFAHKPRLLFFDEATSALDNRTQAIVTGSMERLQITRVVVAHRLSTIQHADRIVVLKEGKVCEEGSYEQLMARRGAFFELARHQIA